MDKAGVDIVDKIVETGIVLKHISQKGCYKEVDIAVLENLLELGQQILEGLRNESFEATIERSRSDSKIFHLLILISFICWVEWKKLRQ